LGTFNAAGGYAGLRRRAIVRPPRARKERIGERKRKEGAVQALCILNPIS